MAEANDTHYGLQAGVFTTDLNKAFYAFEHLEVIEALHKLLARDKHEFWCRTLFFAKNVSVCVCVSIVAGGRCCVE